ncbi:caspase domain-containing protein [Bacteroidota bacterium]
MKRPAYLILVALIISFTHSENFAQTKVSDQGKSIYINTGMKPSSIQLTWIDPLPDIDELKNSACQIKLGVKTVHEIASISFYLNNNLLSQERGFLLVEADDRDDFDNYIEKMVVLKNGINNLKVVVEDEEGYSVSVNRILKFYGPKVIRNDYALLFATDTYDSWNKLINPINDARTIAEELESNYGFKVELVTNASQEEVYTKLRDYADKSYMDNDQLFLFFAGHGQFDDSFREGFVVCKDSRKNDPGKVSYISHSRLRTVVNNIPSKHTFLVMDICFGGTFDPVVASAGYRGEERNFEITHEEFIKKKLKFKTRRYLTSGGKVYVPDGTPGHHSPFVRRFLEALRNYGGHDKVLTLAEIFIYVEKIQPEPRSGEFGDNEPGSDFIFVAQED